MLSFFPLFRLQVFHMILIFIVLIYIEKIYSVFPMAWWSKLVFNFWLLGYLKHTHTQHYCYRFTLCPTNRGILIMPIMWEKRCIFKTVYSALSGILLKRESFDLDLARRTVSSTYSFTLLHASSGLSVVLSFYFQPFCAIIFKVWALEQHIVRLFFPTQSDHLFFQSKCLGQVHALQVVLCSSIDRPQVTLSYPWLCFHPLLTFFGARSSRTRSNQFFKKFMAMWRRARSFPWALEEASTSLSMFNWLHSKSVFEHRNNGLNRSRVKEPLVYHFPLMLRESDAIPERSNWTLDHQISMSGSSFFPTVVCWPLLEFQEHNAFKFLCG